MNLPAWWDRAEWKKKIEEDPRNRALLMWKILDYAVSTINSEWHEAKQKVSEK